MARPKKTTTKGRKATPKATTRGKAKTLDKTQ